MLALAMGINAQTSATYVKDAKFFVSNGTLVYSGGNWTLDATTEKTVENKGNIVIVGNYKGTAADGKEFVNVYTDALNYGQVKILSATAPATAKMTVQRPAASSNYFDASYEMSFPYVDQVNYVMNSFGLPTNDFKGDCPVGVTCANRYTMTLTKWDNNKLHHDAVQTVDKFQAGDIYNLALTEAKMKEKMVGNIPYKGTPTGVEYKKTAKGVITALTEAQFISATYNAWKVLVNPYNERYESYMGYVDTEDRIYAKNTYRFGNPYTSNLDLSAFSGPNAWLTILNNNGSLDLKQATTGQLIGDFTIHKRKPTYDYNWKAVGGSINVTNATDSYYTARINIDATRWEGDAEALLIRPTETFALKFPKLNASRLGKTRIVNVQVNFKDIHKTFEHKPSPDNGTTGLTPSPLSRMASLSTSSLSSTPVTASSSLSPDFYQLKVSLIKDNVSLSSAYLVGDNKYKESGDASTYTNDIFVYGITTDGKVAYESKKAFNEFNLVSSIGKPMGVGFGNLVQGATYQLKFNLYENSIFNEVTHSPSALFFLKDNKTNKIVQIDPAKTYRFVADKNIAQRLEIYWKQVPVDKNIQEKPSIDLESPTSYSQNTVIYEAEGQGKIRFENISDRANLQIYNALGVLVHTENGVSTSSDYTVNVATPGMYIVKVAYQNGEVRTVKFINK